jgi:hypothetical protein
MKPRVFIVSSKEGLDVARAMQSELDNWAETTIWSQAVFTPSSTALDDLIRISGEYDFGVFVFSFEDIVKIRDQEYRSTRDNVVFELGIFIGKLGKERTFLVTPETQNNFHLPTDLIGLTYLTFDSERTDGNLQAALGSACTRIIDRIRKITASALLIKEREEESDNLLKIIRRIVELHQVAYSDVHINDWTVVHAIDENGTDHLHEEFTLIPQAEPLYFYLLESNYLEREHESTMNITARNGGNGVPLSLLQLGRSRGIVSHAVVLDPPATKERPQRVVIDCHRQSMWKDLLEKGTDQGVLRVANKTDLLHFEFRVPQGRTWKGLNPTPEVGQITVTPSTVVWDIPEPNTGRFSFKLFLD